MSLLLTGAGGSDSVTAFVGAGNVVSGASFWGSAARAYTAAYAAGGGALIDIVDSAGLNPATINSLTTGFCDLATLNTWIGLHGTASVKKLYDQSGNGFHLTQATVSKMPTITVSAINGLPGMTGAGVANLNVTSTLTIGTSPLWTWSFVAKRTSGTSLGSVAAAGTGIAQTGFDGANTAFAFGGNSVADVAGVADGSFHAIQTSDNSAVSSHLYVDGGNNTVVLGAIGSPFTNIDLNLFTDVPANNNPFTGIIMEAGYWQSDFNGGNNALMNSNQHGTNGYNF